MSSLDSRLIEGSNLKRARVRPSFSSTKTGSSFNTIISSSLLEQNNTETYAGVTSEIVPSSIVSFHHPHSFNSQNYGSSISSNNIERGGRISTEIDSLLSQGQPIIPHNSHSRSSSKIHGFTFFTEEQVENAQGVSSTFENVDYDMNWNSNSNYEQYKLHTQPRLSYSSGRVSPIRSYGTINDTRDDEYEFSPDSFLNSLHYTHKDRIPIEVEQVAFSNLSGDETSDQSNDENSERGFIAIDSHTQLQNIAEGGKRKIYSEYLKPEYHDRFYPFHVPHLHFQRFYIAEEDLVVGIAGYKNSLLKSWIYYSLCIITLGMLCLVCKWNPRYKVKFVGSKTSLGKAEWVAIENEFGEFSVVKVNREWYNRPLSTILPVIKGGQSIAGIYSNHYESENNPNVPILISFTYRYVTMVYSPLDDVFKTNNNWVDHNWLDLQSVQKGLSTSTQEDRLLAFGKNTMNLKAKTTTEILFDEVVHPFYVFQIFSIILWLIDDYYYYAACILVISVMSIIESLLETKQAFKKLSEVSDFTCEVRVYKDGFWSQVNSSELVPGDIYEISDPSLTFIPCDCILISGDCIVNESMLTGESVPVSKYPATGDTMEQLLDDFKNTQISNFVSKSFLFNGTKLIKVRIPTGQSISLAMVVRTGFSTTKGSLIRSMVFPRSVGFKFYQDSFKYIMFMSLIALIGFLISCTQFIRLGIDYKTMILRALDIITIVVPPALPATLTIGTSFALSRLKKKSIFCIAPTKVNVGGKIDIVCFDKTGTLTEDGLDVLGIHLIKHTSRGLQLGELTKSVSELFDKTSSNDYMTSIDSKARDFLKSLLTCHSLRLVDDQLLGDPLDYKMFQFTKWEYSEDFYNSKIDSIFKSKYQKYFLPDIPGINTAIVYPKNRNEFVENDTSNILYIVRSFEFLSQLRCMSVIVKVFNEEIFTSFTKGAPEVIFELCNPSTLPSNFDTILSHYTHNGYRVIACAGKHLPKNTWSYVQKVSREEIESNLEFLGFIIFENKLKTSTKSTLETLHEANIRMVMCTGDNILTAISVGRESGLIKCPRVFVPYLNKDVHHNQNSIIWQDMDNTDSYLDSITLAPRSICNDDYTLAITGEIFRILFQNNEIFPESYINNILMNCSVYARMSPDEKHELVEQLQKLDYNVSFCGDGANDCGALKAADVGISLSEAEASIAAPFTSRVFEITCVLDIIMEGRASLVTSFSCFQYMSLYSAIQFITVTILYSQGSNLGDFQFLYIDLFLIIPIAIFMSWSKPYNKLVKKRPSANLISPKILMPLCANIIIIFIFQAIPWLIIQRTPWYIKPIITDDGGIRSSDNTILFFISNFQYILVAIMLSVGPPYREPASKNIGFILDAIISIMTSIFLMNIDPISWFGNIFQLTNIPISFKFFIIFWSCLNYYTQIKISSNCKYWFKKKKSSKKYKNLLSTLKQSYQA